MQPKSIQLHTIKDKFSFVISILLEQKFFLISYVCFSFLTSFLSAITPYFLKLQIDQLEQQHSTFLLLHTNPLLLFIILLTIPVILELFETQILSRLTFKSTIQLRTRIGATTEQFIWQKLNTLDAGFFQSKRNKKIIKDALNSSMTVDRVFSFITYRFSSSISFFTILPLLALISWKLLLLIIFAAVAQLIVSKYLRSQSEGYSLAESKANDSQWKVYDLLEQKFYELQTMGNIQFFIDQYQSLRAESDNLYIRRETAAAWLKGTSWLLDRSLIVLTSIYVGYQVFKGQESIGTFMLVTSYTQLINNFFHTIINSMNDWQDIDYSLTKLGFFFSLQSRLKNSSHPIPIPNVVKNVTLKNVSFSYPSQSEDERAYFNFLLKRIEKWINSPHSGGYRREIEEIQALATEEESSKEVIHDTSLTIKRGQITALVGRNGSGKTTITHLLQHHYEPSHGEIFLNNTPLNEYEQESLLKQFAWLTQQPFIVERQSVRTNLLLGSDESREIEERLWSVLNDLDLKNLIISLPKQLDTIVDEDTSFSGGQRQLLALARSLIQQRPFIIFDEGSSQLDIEKEFLVLQQLQKYKEQAGILFITHRMSVARKADYIYVIDEGKIIEEGTHAELSEQADSLYAKFWKMQMVE